MSIPRPEYPRPQFERADWLNLNGEWQFEIDMGDSGAERGLKERELSEKIMVPFCPESELSGVNNRDFLNAVWYRKSVEIPNAWKGRNVLLHFQACDYDTTVWVNGKEVARHRGGFTPFTCDLAGVADAGTKATIVVRARDSHIPPQPRGKQSQQFGNHGCLYVRTTGIWQTVWMEPVAETAMKRPRITPDLANGRFHLDIPLSATREGLKLRAKARDAQGVVAEASTRADLSLAASLDLNIPEAKRKAWSIKTPHLYDIELELVDASGAVVDRANSYAGLRSVGIQGKAILINGEKVFQRLVLDQGYYPDGILTAPSDAALKKDIELSMEAGFNGARLHQKVFEERFLYHADKMGYLCWGEFADWGCGHYGKEDDHQRMDASYVTQWLEAVERDYSHPSIIGWCPLNETWQPLADKTTQLEDVTRGMFLATKAMDTSRPVLDTSGYSHRVLEADVYDSHDYEQDPKKFYENQKGLAEGKPFINKHQSKEISTPYRGQPYFVSEFGGIWWNPVAKPTDFSWGYGERPKTVEDFYARFDALCAVLLDNKDMFGYCYTQLTDVYQEQNGIFTFSREKKFDMKRVAASQMKRAAIEKL